MRWRVVIWVVLGGLLGVAIWRCSSIKQNSADAIASSLRVVDPATLPSQNRTTPTPLAGPKQAGMPFRLSNTSKSLDSLIRDPHAILLENALLDTTAPFDLDIPTPLRHNGDPGSYIVQSRRELNQTFRAVLRVAGANIISYIPNNAYLVTLNSVAARTLASNPEVGAVLPYEPYYKIKASLLSAALQSETDASDAISIRLLLFQGLVDGTLSQLAKAGIEPIAKSSSPFGTIAQVTCPSSQLAWIAQLAGIAELEPAHHRVSATDLTRARLGVASGAVAPANYLGLTGSNVLVNVNDLGVDATHPDLAGRVLSDVPASGTDRNGHGTHVAGIIAGDGTQSQTVIQAPGSVTPPAPRQFRGMAPAANIFSIAVSSESRNLLGDAYLQQTAASRGALISNNSWHYADDSDYDLGAAGFDAAVRDALPGTPGPQPLLYVFAAGNRGGGSSDGTGGLAGTIQSPGTAKNVITVGAIESPRFITNQTWSCSTNSTVVTCQTNAPWAALTDSSNQVASFSSRGNVGAGVEGPSGRFKPDVVAPGTFIVSTRSDDWDQAAYYSTPICLNIDPDPNYGQVLSNLNNGLGPFYRFESGTSLAAAAVSGTLALMEQFFSERLGRTNSPALMKALLINGTKSLPAGYDVHSTGATNSQGWGVVQLPNSLPPGLTNVAATRNAMLIFDQNPSETLATGQQHTRLVSVDPQSQQFPLRVTLAWTDPPGNPMAGLKLVNDLDLIVTNLENGDVFWGNDFSVGSNFTSSWQPGSTPQFDTINNVENIFLQPPLGSNYSVTVSARRVAINAVSEQVSNEGQDYALVISSDDNQSTNALGLIDPPPFTSETPLVTLVTNSFIGSSTDFGAVLLSQTVGAGQPGVPSTFFPSPTLSNAVISVGISNQWHFYIFTNDSPFTNLVFATFLGRSLAMLPGGTPAPPSGELVWTSDADLDLYVSQDPALTNLDPLALATADMSLGRGSAETILYSNAAPGVYYVGVKCESGQAAEFAFLADASLDPFASSDALGNQVLRGFPVPSTAEPGTPSAPGRGYTLFFTPDPFPVHRVIVTNTFSFTSASDLLAVLSHSGIDSVLHDFSTNLPASGQTVIYDDSMEGDISGANSSDGPGNLQDFAGKDASGQWLISIQTTNHSVTAGDSWLFIERQPDLAGNELVTILPGQCRKDWIYVPPQSASLSVGTTLNSGTGPVSFQVFPAASALTNSPELLVSPSAGGTLTVNPFSQPPLNPGLYVVQTCNLGPDPANLSIQSQTVAGQTPGSPIVYTAETPAVILDDAVSASTLSVTNSDAILSVDVGVRIDHPRVSDLVLSLVGPDGTRVLLSQGRGADSTNGMGANLIVTNTTPVSFSGGPEAVTNVFETGETAGAIVLNYDFFSLPDDMHVYYEGKLLYDSGLVSFRGSTNISYGPGHETSFTVVMNEAGNTESNTAWFYSVTSTRIEPLYLTFTENTNLADVPIKFAPPSFTNQTLIPGSSVVAPGIYYLPEEPLTRFVGKNPNGQWRLEILDLQSGATNPPPLLLSWYLAFSLADSRPAPIPIVSGAASTNLLGPGQVQWYEIDVPEWVASATNSLLSASSPVNVWFNPSVPPTGTNAGDRVFGFAATAGDWVLLTNSASGLIPGGRYFVGIQNTNSATVTAAFQVNFDVANVITLSSGVPYANTNLGPLGTADFYRYVVTTNAVGAQFEVNAPSSDLALVLRRGLPLPNLGSYDYLSENPGTNDQLIVIYDYSRPVALTPGEWFLAAVNLTGTPAAYSILATEFGDYGTNLLVTDSTQSGNELCLAWNSLPGAHYVVQGKTALEDVSWTNLSSTLTASDFTTTFCLPLPMPFEYFRVSQGLALVPALPAISSIAFTTNGALLGWSARTNSSFSVQWSPGLSPANWLPIPGTVSSTTGSFQFLDDGSHTGAPGTVRFYRLQQNVGP
jgi:subtilisin-like proprotein convertase family protein